MQQLFLKVEPYILGVHHITSCFRHPGGYLSLWQQGQEEPLSLFGPAADACWNWLCAALHRQVFLQAGAWVLHKQHIVQALERNPRHVSVWLSSRREPVELVDEAAEIALAWLKSPLHTTALSFTAAHPQEGGAQ